MRIYYLENLGALTIALIVFSHCWDSESKYYWFYEIFIKNFIIGGSSLFVFRTSILIPILLKYALGKNSKFIVGY